MLPKRGKSVESEVGEGAASPAQADTSLDTEISPELEHNYRSAAGPDIFCVPANIFTE